MSDGSHNTFYDLPKWVDNIDRLAEYLQLDGYEFNILKSLTYKLGDRHDGTNPNREAKKCLHYAQMRIEKLDRNEE